MLATPQQIIETWEKRPDMREEISANFKPYHERQGGRAPSFAYIEGRLADIIDVIRHNAMGKGVRPWEVVDVTASLDPAQAWIGIEYETGFDDRRDYRRVMSYLWRNHHNNAVDYEGCGAYPAEITFSPVTLEAFGRSSYNMDRLITYLNNHTIPQGENDDDWVQVGIHVNISAPGLRANSSIAHAVASLLSDSIEYGNVNCERFFKRQPYGYFCARGSAGTQHWLEGKLFNSTDSMEVWQEYKTTIHNMALLVTHLATMSISNLEDGRYITNLNEILAGEHEPDAPEFAGDDDDDDDAWSGDETGW